MFCCHCGKPADGGRFCAACGQPMAPEAVEAMSAELHRHRKQMRLMVIALGLVSMVTVGLIVSEVTHARLIVGRSLVGDETTAQQQPATPAAAAQTPPGQAIIPNTFNSQPQQPPQQAFVPDENRPARSSTSSIDPKAVQNALTSLTPHGKQQDPPSKQQPGLPAVSTGSDRYPGSQPVEVKDANLPDIGIPVANEVYTTSDSLATVIHYYTQRYPEAEVMEVSGQKVIAIDRPGVTKVIAIGTTGEETRIAIVQSHK